MRLKSAIIYILVGLGTLPLLAILSLSIPQTLDRLNHASRQESILKLEERNIVLQVRLAHLKEQLFSIARLPGVKEFVGAPLGISAPRKELRNRFVTLMRQWFKNRVDVVGIQLVNGSGKEVMRMIRDTGNVFLPLWHQDLPDRSKAEFFIKGLSAAPGNVYAGDFQVDNGHGAIQKAHPVTFVVSAPIANRQGSTVGVVSLTVEVTDILKEYSDDFWLDANGRRLRFQPTRGKHFHYLINDDQFSRDFLHNLPSMLAQAKEKGFKHPVIRDMEQTVGEMAWQPINANHEDEPFLWVGSQVPRSQTRDWLEQLLVSVSLVSFLLIVCVVIVAEKIATRVDVKKTELLQALKAIIADNKEAPHLDWSQVRETRELAHEINTLARSHKHINRSRLRAEEELQKHLEHLEDEVASRTDELVVINRQLQEEVEQRQKTEKELLRHRDNLDELVQERTQEVLLTNAKLAQEVEDRQKADLALEKSEKRQRAILDSVNTGIFIVDPENFSIVYANSAAASIIGADKPEDVVGNQCFHFFSQASEHTCPVVIDSQKIDNAERVLTKLDGTKVTVLKTVVPFADLAAEKIFFLESMIDITNQKQVQEENKKLQSELYQSQKLKAIGLLAGGVAHDFNNLLTVIQGFTSIALRELGKGDPMRQRFEQIKAGVSRASSLIRQLLLFSRKQPVKTITLNLNNSIEDLMLLLQRLLGEDIIVEFDKAPELPLIQADAGNIDQIIMNLAVNSRDAMPVGGRLTIKTENVNFQPEDIPADVVSKQLNFVCLSVSDTGQGIPEDIKEHIFEPFYTTKEVGKGTGLGLSVIYGIVKQHGGWVNVKSEEQVGTTFRLYLPLAETMISRGDIEEEKENLQGRGELILVVEDEERVAEFACEALNEYGLRTVLARSVEEARQLYDEKRSEIALIFCDVVLPDGNGIQFVDEILTQSPDLPVVFTSGYTDQRAQWSVIIERGFTFLQKPYDMGVLTKIVRKVVGAG